MFHGLILAFLLKNMDTLKSILNNPHTSLSAVVLFTAAAVGVIWPQYKDKAQEISNLAIVYGLIRAGDAKPAQPEPPKP